MISYNYEVQFKLGAEHLYSEWIANAILNEECVLGEINYIFCNDQYLHKLNVEFLEHDTLTDIISFDYSVGKELHGDIFISIERVEENAKEFNEDFSEELKRVMIHGILHYCGYKDKTKAQAIMMRSKEDHYLKTFPKKN